MKIVSLSKYSDPKYPIRQVLDEHPELLCNVPQRWKGNPVVLSALAGVGLLLSACKSDAADKKDQKAAVRIAPLFIHGDGRGAYGCEVVNPPVFLSEEEAKDVITQEAKKAGITFTEGITLKITPPMKPQTIPELGGLKPATEVSLEMDGTNKKRNISYEFVSDDDVRSWQGPSMSSVESIDAKSAAESLRAELKKSAPAGTYAVFYEPIGNYQGTSSLHTEEGLLDWKRMETEGKKMNKEELRKQVKDFIKWLKAEGII